MYVVGGRIFVFEVKWVSCALEEFGRKISSNGKYVES